MADDFYESRLRAPAGPSVTLDPVRTVQPDFSPAGEALQNFGKAMAQHRAQIDAAKAETDDASLKTGLLTRLHELEAAGTRPDANYRAAPVEFNKSADELIKEKTESIIDESRREKFKLWATTHILTSRGRVEKTALANEADANRGNYLARASEYQRRVTLAGSPIEREAVIQEWDRDIGRQEASGWFGRQEAEKLRFDKVKLVGEAVLAQTEEGLQHLRNELVTASDAPSVYAATAAIRTRGEALLRTAGLPPLQTDAAVRAWHRQAAETGLHRMAAVDPAAARLAGGRAAPEAGLVNRIVQAESGGRADLANPDSTALGAGQFIEGTWLTLMATYRPELVTGRTREQVLSLRTDPALARDMVARYAEQNAGHLRARGLPTTNANVYLSHFLGPGGAVNVLSVDPRTPVEQVLSPAQIAANKSVLAGKTAGEVQAWAARKAGAGDAMQAGGGDPLFAAVPYEERARILDAAEQSTARGAEALEKQAAELRKRQGDDVLKEAYARAEKGELTGGYVEAIRALVSPAEYKNLLAALGPGAASDDAEAMIDLTTRIDADDPQEFQKQAADYLRRGKLKTDTFLSLSEKNRGARRDDAPSSPYRSGRDLVKNALDPGLLVTGSARAPLAMSQATALTEFDNWAQANPEADRAAAFTAAQDIVRRYQVVDFDKVKISLGSSRYFGGRDRAGVTLEDIDAAETALLRDDQAGLLSTPQMLLEVQRLKNWRAILDKEQAAKESQRGRKP